MLLPYEVHFLKSFTARSTKKTFFSWSKKGTNFVACVKLALRASRDLLALTPTRGQRLFRREN